MLNYILSTVELLHFSNKQAMQVRNDYIFWDSSNNCFAESIKKGSIEQYLTDARGNSHKKALLCAAYASTRHDEHLAGEYMQVSLNIAL